MICCVCGVESSCPIHWAHLKRADKSACYYSTSIVMLKSGIVSFLKHLKPHLLKVLIKCESLLDF